MKTSNIIILVVLWATVSVNAQTKQDKIDSLITGYYQQKLFNGTALISEKGKPIYSKGFGYSNLEWEIENEIDTKFKIGSCTKPFTATLIMMLKEEGKLSLDDKIIKFIPDYPAGKGDQITIHHLLSHTSGIPNYLFLPIMQKLQYENNIPKEFIKNFWDLDLEFTPGDKFNYSNSGYFILGVIIEKITGKSYSEVLQEKIFQPLSMNNSGIANVSEVLSKKAYGYVKVKDNIMVAPYINESGAFSAGAIYSTVQDLIKFIDALMSNKILSKESVTEMITIQSSGYGYGFGILKQNLNGPKTLFGHEGMIYGYRSLIHNIKEDQITIILLDNNQNPNLMKISMDILKILYGL